MRKLCGTIKKVIRAETRESPCLFEVRLPEKAVVCSGHLFKVSKKMPLMFFGDFDEDGVFQIAHTETDFYNETGMIRFLSGAAFPGVGSLKSSRIYHALAAQSKTGKITKADTIRIFTENGAPACGLRFYDTVTGISRRTALYKEISTAGGSWPDAESLYTQMGDKALGAIRESPYLGVSYGIPFPVCDTLAGKYGRFVESDRMDALCRYLADYIKRNGSSCIPVKQAVQFMARAAKGTAPLPDGCLLSVLISNRNYIVQEHILPDGSAVPVVSPSDLLRRENDIAGLLTELDSDAEDSGITQFDENGLDEDQKSALRTVLCRSGISVVTGAPGAGKTTLIRRIISTYRTKFPDGAIRIGAPTGRAAARISESLGAEEDIKAVTVHRMIGAKPYTEDTAQYAYNETHKLPKGLYVIDEASMLDEHITRAFLGAVTHGSYIVFTGDPDQLLSVDTGTVLQDIINSGVIRTCRLTRLHRQSEKSLIAENYRKIVKHDTALSEGPDFHIIRCGSDREAADAAIRLCRKYYDGSPYGFEILTCVKKGITGKDSINRTIISGRHSGKGKYERGDRIMMTANNYQKGYLNGDIGEIKEVMENGIVVQFYDGKKEIEGDSLHDTDYAFACTVHKAQGSEYDRTAVILDDSAEVMLQNRLILTAVTRAKKECFVISKGDALERAIKNARAGERHTMLCDLLRKRKAG